MTASGRLRENGSAPSGPAIAASAVIASSTVSEKIDTQSSVRHAGTTPAVEINPRLGFSPTMLLSIAGTRPGPAPQGPWPGRHRHRRSRTRSSRNEVAAHRIVRNAIGRTHADEAGGEL